MSNFAQEIPKQHYIYQLSNMKTYNFLTLIIMAALALSTNARNKNVIVNGIPWYDQNGEIVNSHGSCIVRDGSRYWLFGEYKTDSINSFLGFGCYSSEDLATWKFERIVLPVQKDGILGPNRVGERVKVMRCPKTGKYVMLMHADDMDYRDPHIGLAIADSINGDYRLLGTLLYKERPIKRWDMGTFQDSDGKGYLLIHHGPIYRLSDDYLSVDTMVADIKGMGESPTMFRKGDTYYLLTSNLTSWERNDNYYFTAPSIAGPWIRQGLLCPKGTLTWNTQCTFIYPQVIKEGETPMYMGDRWSYPRQGSAATNVWLPITVNGDSLSIPKYMQAWDASSFNPVDVLKGKEKVFDKTWAAKTTGDKLSVSFTGTQAAVTGTTDKDCGYALVSITDASGNTVYSSLVDFYSNVNFPSSIRIITPKMPRGKYKVTIEATGTQPNWSNKRGDKFGATDCFVRVDGVYAM